ncbi:MAG: hypothetical protein H6888_10235 [Nitratireductor sp.]|nr:hypothetical protein [Nitratireductor sp.]
MKNSPVTFHYRILLRNRQYGSFKHKKHRGGGHDGEIGMVPRAPLQVWFQVAKSLDFTTKIQPERRPHISPTGANDGWPGPKGEKE